MVKKATYEQLENRIKELEQETYALKSSLKLLSRKEQAIQTLVNAPTESALLIEPKEGIILACNEIAAQSLNSSADGIIGLSIYDLLSADLAKSRKRQAEKVVHSGKPLRFQDKRDGRAYEISLYPVLGAQQEVTQVAVFAQEVTERLQIEAAQRESRQRYRLLVENQNDLIVKLDTEFRFLYVSPSYCETFGKREDELLGNKFMPLIHEQDRDRVADSLKRLFEEPYTCYHEERALTKNGWRWFAWSDKAELNEGGRVEAILAIGRDITDRKQAEEALKLSEARLRTAIDCLPFDFFIIGNNGRYEMVNTVCRRFGGDVVGKRPEDLSVSKKDLALWKENNRRAFSGETVKGEVELSVKGEKGYYYNIIAPVKSKDEILGILGVNIDITRIKHAEAALKESERKYRNLVELCPDAIVILQGQHYQFVNPAFSRIFGYTQEDVDQGLSFFELVKADDREAVRRQYERRLSGEKVPRTYNIKLVAKDGSIIPCETSGSLIDYNGRPADLVIIRDISERKQLEEVLQESEKRYRELVETMNQGLAAIDKEMKFTFVNDKFCQILGYARGELIGRYGIEVLNEADQEVYRKQMARRRLGEHDPYEIAFTHKSGEQVFAIVSPRPIFNAKGQYEGSFAVITNITERKQAERALQESEEKYRVLVEQAQEGIVILQGFPPGVVFANRAMATILGYPITELMAISSEDIGNLIHPDDRKAIMQRLADRLKGKRIVPSRYEARGIRRDGSILWLNVSATSITYRGTQAVQATFMDITDRKLAEQELQKAHNELEMRVKARTAELRTAFKELEVKSKSLEETNTALKVLLEKRDGDKVELEEKLTSNVSQLVEPYLEKLKSTNLDERQKAFLSIVEANLKDITSPFLRSLTGQHLKLTPTEIQVAELVKQGKSAKEIADVMNLSWKTVKTHRRNIRSKLNLRNKKTNLRSYLLSNQK